MPREDTVTESRLLLIGSGGFALPAFAALRADPTQTIVGVVTAAPRAAGRDAALRQTPVAEWAAEEGLPLLQVARLRDASTQIEIRELGATIALLADFGQLVPAELLASLPRGALNLHPSLLPAHRGASPIPAAILAGDHETGVSTIVMDEGLDTGSLLAVQRYLMRGDEDAPLLEARLAALAAERIVATTHDYLSGRLTPTPQPATGASLTRRLKRTDGAISADWTAEAAHRAWRAYRPWPGTWVSVSPLLERLILDTVGEPVQTVDIEPGHFALREGELLLGLQEGALPLLEVTPAGGHRMSGAELVRGRSELLAPHARIRS